MDGECLLTANVDSRGMCMDGKYSWVETCANQTRVESVCGRRVFVGCHCFWTGSVHGLPLFLDRECSWTVND